MTRAKQIGHFAGTILKALVLAVLSYLVFAVILGLIPVNSNFVQAQNGIPVYVISNGVHTDIVVPLKTPVYDWSHKLQVKDFKGADSTFTHLAFGWGDRNFYMNTPEWTDLTFSIAFEALFIPSASAMHIYYMRRPPAVADQSRKLLLSEDQYEKLTNYFLQSFTHTASDQVILIPGKGYGPRDNFYEANEKFFIGKTCNTWTGRALRKAGIKTGLWTPFPFSVMKHLPEPK